MLTFLLFVAAAGEPAVLMTPPPDIPLQEAIQGPMPAENTYLLPGRPGENALDTPDIAIAQLRIDGDTLFVQVVNRGAAAKVPVLVAARAEIDGARTDLAEARTPRLGAGESRWVPLKGFSVKAASNAATVFALANATAVSAVARLMPSTAGSLDRSGQGCGRCSIDANDSNNSLTLSGAAIPRGHP